MLYVLESYYLERVLSVNIAKTAVMVLNRAGRILKDSKNFSYGCTMYTHLFCTRIYIIPTEEHEHLIVPEELDQNYTNAGSVHHLW